MEDSRKGKRSGKKGLPTLDPYVDGGNGKKAIVYNTKGGKKRRGDRKKEKEKKRERKREKVKNRVLLSDSIRAYPRILPGSIYANNSFLLTL